MAEFATSPFRHAARKAGSATSVIAGLLAAPVVLSPAVAAWAPDHVVIVIEENHSYTQIIGNSKAPFINKLAQEGALFTDAHGVQHPSQPNYLALFSGSTQGVDGDKPAHGLPLVTDNLGAQLIAHGHSFIGYSESLPGVGSMVGTVGPYVRRHNPWSNWQSAHPAQNQLSASTNQPFEVFPSNFDQLPTVAFVVPNLDGDEHGGLGSTTPDPQLIPLSDTWLEKHLAAYAQWAKTHNSLLVITWDEDNYTKANHIPIILYGSDVRTGNYAQHVDHYSVLRMIERFYGLEYIGASSKAADIVGAVP